VATIAGWGFPVTVGDMPWRTYWRADFVLADGGAPPWHWDGAHFRQFWPAEKRRSASVSLRIMFERLHSDRSSTPGRGGSGHAAGSSGPCAALGRTMMPGVIATSAAVVALGILPGAGRARPLAVSFAMPLSHL